MIDSFYTLSLTEDSFLKIEGETDILLNNPRLKISLARLHANYEDDYILIPVIDNNSEYLIREISQLLLKFNYKSKLDSSIDEILDNFRNEMENFEIFSKKALDIRNNDFSKSKEITEDFRVFKKIIDNTLYRTLYNMQLLSAFHIAFAQNACNFAVPGSGKTSIVYAAFSYLKSLPKNDIKHVDKILVVGPLSSFAPWENEYYECFNYQVDSQRLSGDSSISLIDKENHLYSSTPKTLTLVSHAGMNVLQDKIIDFLKQNKTLLVIDEAHRIKNVDGQWGKAAIEISKYAKSRVILTGTPIPNGYEDIYNLFKFIYPYKYKEILKISYAQLKNLTTSNADIKNPRVFQLYENIKPFFLRIKKSDLSLPPVNNQKIYVEMDDIQEKIYSRLLDTYSDFYKSVNSGSRNRYQASAKLMRLRQASINPKLLLKPLSENLEFMGEDFNDDQLNITAFEEILEDNEILKLIFSYKDFIPRKFTEALRIYKDKVETINEKIIIWTIFIQNAEEIKDYFESNNIATRLLIGSVPQSEREAIIEKFNNPNNHDFSVVIANPFSVSESISLHKGCHNALYLERDYNASNFIQSKDRIHRVGLNPDTITNYYYLITKDSVDYRLDNKLDMKVERMEKLINNDIPLFVRLNSFNEDDIVDIILREYAERSK